ncbi:hypothetical protein F5Y01DRAFT_275119 [Xylaria sp. FL0043]|nr:hypothetical protein F5Y01DRAFT_275119 [Xylaria sp. FL0043]
MTTPFLRSLMRIVFTVALICSVFCAFASATSPPAASPAAETELICHTDNPAECYPKLFSATEEFQVVHDDQDLPPGLHVQLDVQTGQKQAKLYNPDEENPALAGLPVDQGVVVVDPEPPQNREPRIPAGAPKYEPVGMVKAPQEKNEDFSQALQTIKKSSERRQSIETSVLDEALLLLDDLSHDMYYGLQIAEDAEAVQSLFCLLSRGDELGKDERPFTERTDFMASSILSAAIGNNAKALAAIGKSWDSITGKHCEKGFYSIRQELLQHLIPTSSPRTEQESEEAELLRLYLPIMSGLLKSPEIRTEFLENGGLMESFLLILLRDGDVWEPRRAKVAQIISDTFLDEDFGATLGIWPRKQQIDATECAKIASHDIVDECWAYYLDLIAQQGNGAPEWSEHLRSLILQANIHIPSSETPPKHNEL